MVLNGKKNMSRFNENFFKKYNENTDNGYILEVDVEYPKNLNDLYSDLLFLSERKKIIKAAILYVTCIIKITILFIIRSLNQVLKHGLMLKKVH